MSTIHTSATRPERLAVLAARRRSRVLDALDGADALDVSAAALAVLTALSRRQARRLPTALAQTLDADDIAQRTALRLLSTTDGALMLAALTSASTAARLAAARRVERAARSIVGTVVRDGTVAADVSADALTSDVTTGPLAHRGTVESERVRAALDAADASDVRIDGDRARVVGLGHVESRARSAGAAAARRAGLDAVQSEHVGEQARSEARRRATRRGATWERVSEQTTEHAVRIVRVQSLDALLSSPLRVPLPTESRGAESAGRTLSGVLADVRDTAAPFRAAFGTALDAAVSEQSGRGADVLRAAVAVLDARSAAGWRSAATDARRAVLDALDAADAATVAEHAAARTASEHRGAESKRAARSASESRLAAERRHAHALHVWQVTALAATESATGGRVRLSTLCTLALTASTDGAARSGTSGGARRRTAKGESAARSTLSLAVVLDVLDGTTDTASATAKALRAALTTAASTALDAAALTPRPSVPLALHRARTNLHGDGIDGRRASIDAARHAVTERRTARRDAAARSLWHAVAAAVWHVAQTCEPRRVDVPRTATYRRALGTVPAGTFAAALLDAAGFPTA